MPEPVQVVDEHSGRFAEVEVEHVDAFRVARQADQRSGLARRPQRVEARIVVSDVEQHDAVDHVRRRDALDGARAIGVGDHQDVVAQLRARRRDREDVLQHRGRELVLVELAAAAR